MGRNAVKEPVYVIAKRGPWSHDEARMVRVIRIVEEVAVSDTTIYEVEDVLDGKLSRVEDYYLDMNERFNEMEVIAWAATQ